MNIEGLSASEIGRRYAPDHIKDRAGWGRKWARRELTAGTVEKLCDGTFTQRPTIETNAAEFTDRLYPDTSQLDVAHDDEDPDLSALEDMNQSEASHFAYYMKGGDIEKRTPPYAHRYKAPHALRGTPPRPHFSNRRRKKLVCNR